MNYYGRLRIEGPHVSIPGELTGMAQCWLFNPVPRTDLTLLTHSHIIELKEGLIQRSGKLPESISSPVKIEVLTNNEGWFYVVQSLDTLVLYSGETLQQTKRFNDVLSSRIGDFLNICKPLLFIQFRSEDPVLTDGSTQFNVNQVWPPEIQRDKVQQTLDERLKTSRRCLQSSRLELEATKTFVEDTLRSLAVSCIHVPTIQEESLQSLVDPRREQMLTQTKYVIKFREDKIKVLGDNIVVIMSLETTQPIEELEIQSLCRDGSDLIARSHTIILRKENGFLYPEYSTNLKPGDPGFGLLLVPISLLALHTASSVQLSVLVTSKQGMSCVKTIVLDTGILLVKKPVLEEGNISFHLDFLAAFACGVRECLKIQTELGTLVNLHRQFEKMGFTASPRLFGYCSRLLI